MTVNNVNVPLVSVVVPTHRPGPWLRAAVQSVLDQTYARWELVVVADGCTLTDSDVAGTDERVRVVQTPRVGVSRARNAGIAATAGDWVALLDHDDVWLPEKLESQVEALTSTQSRNPGICYCGARRTRNGVTFAEDPALPLSYLDLLGKPSPMVASSVLVARWALDDVGCFDWLYPLAQDYELVLRVARHYDVVAVPLVLVEYHWHAANASHDQRGQCRELTEILSRHYRAALQQGDAAAADAARTGIAAYRQIYSRGAYERFARAARAGSPRAAVTAAADGLSFDPVTFATSLGRRLRRSLRAGGDGVAGTAVAAPRDHSRPGEGAAPGCGPAGG